MFKLGTCKIFLLIMFTKTSHRQRLQNVIYLINLISFILCRLILYFNILYMILLIARHLNDLKFIMQSRKYK